MKHQPPSFLDILSKGNILTRFRVRTSHFRVSIASEKSYRPFGVRTPSKSSKKQHWITSKNTHFWLRNPSNIVEILLSVSVKNFFVDPSCTFNGLQYVSWELISLCTYQTSQPRWILWLALSLDWRKVVFKILHFNCCVVWRSSTRFLMFFLEWPIFCSWFKSMDIDFQYANEWYSLQICFSLIA